MKDIILKTNNQLLQGMIFLIMFFTQITLFAQKNNFVSIPDPVFEKYLIDAKIDSDNTVNGRVSKQDILPITKIALESGQVKSLAGIEAFNNLESFACTSDSLMELNLSKNKKLRKIFFYKCRNLRELNLTELSLLENISLEYVDGLEKIQLPKYKSTLKEIELWGGKFKAINLSNYENLTMVRLISDQLIDIKLPKSVEVLRLINNQLENLDLSQCLNIIDLDIMGNCIEEIDISMLNKLKYFSCRNNPCTKKIYIPNDCESKSQYIKLEKDDTAVFIDKNSLEEYHENELIFDNQAPPQIMEVEILPKKN